MNFFIDVLYQYQFGITSSYISYKTSSGAAMLGIPPKEIGEREIELFLKVG